MSGFSEAAGDGWLEPVADHPQRHRDRLAAWREHAYRATISAFRLLKRRMALVNTPESVRHVLSTRNDN